MLSVAIHKDIAEYQPKVIGKLTGRTLISITVALGLSIAVVDRLLQVRDGLCGGFRAGTGCRAGVGGDRRHHGGVLRGPVTGLGECRER